MIEPQHLKNVADKLLPIAIGIGTAIWIKSYSEFLEKYGSFGAYSLFLTLIAIVIAWDMTTGRLAKWVAQLPSRKFLGTWLDVAWNEALGDLTPELNQLDGGAWINVVEREGILYVRGYLFSVESLQRGQHTGQFESKAIYVDETTLKFEYLGGSGLTLPPGFGWYNLIQAARGHKEPEQWKGYFFKKGQPAQYSKARRVSHAELKDIRLDSDMAKAILKYAGVVCRPSTN
jgi:hypothetical protein